MGDGATAAHGRQAGPALALGLGHPESSSVTFALLRSTGPAIADLADEGQSTGVGPLSGALSGR